MTTPFHTATTQPLPTCVECAHDAARLAGARLKVGQVGVPQVPGVNVGIPVVAGVALPVLNVVPNEVLHRAAVAEGGEERVNVLGCPGLSSFPPHQSAPLAGHLTLQVAPTLVYLGSLPCRPRTNATAMRD